MEMENGFDKSEAPAVFNLYSVEWKLKISLEWKLQLKFHLQQWKCHQNFMRCMENLAAYYFTSMSS